MFVCMHVGVCELGTLGRVGRASHKRSLILFFDVAG